LGATFKKEYTQISYGNPSEMFKMEFNSTQIVNDLIDKGCIKNKSLLLNFPSLEQVPYELLHHFIRGYIDGDGSISILKDGRYQLGITSTKNMLEGINNFFKEQVDNKNQIFEYKNKKAYYMHIGGNTTALKTLDIIYKDANIFMERKYDKYLLIKQIANGKGIK